MTLFTRYAYQLKNGVRRTVLPSEAAAKALLKAEPATWRYARVSRITVPLFKPRFGVVESLKVRVPRKAKETTVNIVNVAPTRKVRSPRAASTPNPTTTAQPADLTVVPAAPALV
jgi:hypothetical protein